ncbi:metal ABC transporter substrate-binding protein [Nocardioides aurantiacus]|uniref:Zinc transport system substrate-binding protein n=1 Tax=Nocardioides aurantiacus TaxID=86796 RepID=A0A3N2CV72_9ACTN|nr:metal ABC transporter substrate-binding protein [Nocardioides aurantiacus]ROR91452.1 zinc transport system substrate-binding protein [Nocardioides aurantiacus]
MRSIPTALTGTLLAASALSGCAAFSDDGAGASGGDGLQVVAAFYPLQYVAQRVAGDRAEVDNLTKPGGEPHDLEIPPSETARIVDADLLVVESGFQPAVDDSVGQNATGEVVDAADVVELLPAGEEHAGESAEEHAEHAEHEGEEGHSEEEEEEGHDHGDVDPHFWQDPARMARLADAVAEKLAEVDPDHADEYAANAGRLRDELTDLDTAYDEGLSDCERDTVVVSHDAFGYLEKYGLTMEPIAGLSPGAEPTPADLARLQDLIGSDGITTVFSERLVSPRLSESLARDAGVATAVLDPVEGLSDQTADDDYLSLMRSNLAALQKANGCR